MSELRRRTREVTPAEYEELQELVFALVRERLVKAIGVGGMWSINFRQAGDTDSFFGETVAERLAWDVASNIAPQAASTSSHAADVVPAEIFEAPVLDTPNFEAPELAPAIAATLAPPLIEELVSLDTVAMDMLALDSATLDAPTEWARFAPHEHEAAVARAKAANDGERHLRVA